MADLTVWKFDSPDGAKAVLQKLSELQKQHLIEIQDNALTGNHAELIQSNLSNEQEARLREHFSAAV